MAEARGLLNLQLPGLKCQNEEQEQIQASKWVLILEFKQHKIYSQVQKYV